jgi:MFS family permease
LLASAVVAAAAVFYQAFVDITWLSSAIWIQLRRAPGLMGDANPMAVAAALSAPLAILLFRGPAQLPIGVILALLLWAAAWLTGARTVVLLAGAGMIGVTSGAIAERTTPRRAAQFALVAVVMTAGVVLVLALSGAPIGGPIARLTSTLPLERPVDLLYEVLWQRDGYGAAAATAIREHPWSGVGHGAFYSMSSYFYRLDGGPLIPPDNAQNLWRQSLAERGLLAFPAVVAFTVATFRLLARRPEHSTFFYAWTLKALVIGLGLVLVLGFPIQDAAIALTAASLLAWLYAAVVGPDHDRRPLSPLAIGMVWALALAGAAVDARHARTDLRPPWRAARLADPYSYGFGEIEVGRRGATGRVVTSHAVLALRATGPRYRLRCWVRGNDARHVRVWQNQRLIMDELLPAGVIVERVVNSRPNEPAVFEFRTEPPGMVVSGEFEQ